MKQKQKIPLVLVTGFLGAGKTTLLERFVSQTQGCRMAFLVNEFSSVDVDGGRLDLPADRLVTVCGGSIFCKCKVTDFIEHLANIADASPAFEGVIVEASGMANPMVISKMLHETKLDEKFILTNVISVVDPGTFCKLIHTLPNIRLQTQASSVVIINKVDAYDMLQVEETRKAVQGINADAKVQLTSYCDVDVDFFDFASAMAGEGEYAKCIDPNYSKTFISISGLIDLEALRQRISQVGSGLYRAKGIVRSSDGLVDVDLSASGWRVKAAADRTGQTGIVFINSPQVDAEITDIKTGIQSGVFSLIA